MFQLKAKVASSPSHNSDKESDYGYSSSKSHDTLSTSITDNPKSASPNHSRKQPTNPKQYKIKKEERSVKCKSNDSYIYTKNGSQAPRDVTDATSRLTKNKSTKIQTTINKIKNTNSTNGSKFAKLNNRASAALNDVPSILDEEFVKKTTSQQLSVSFKELEEASTCSSTSFNTSSHEEGGKNLNLSPSISLTSSSASSYPNDANITRSPKNRQVIHDPNVTNTTSSDLLNTEVEFDAQKSHLYLLNSLSTPVMMSQSLTMCESNTEQQTLSQKNSVSDANDSLEEKKSTGVKQSLSVSMNMSQASSGTIKSRSSRLINSIIRMSTIGSPFNHSPQINRSSTIDSTLSSPKQTFESASRAHHHASSYFPSFTNEPRPHMSTSTSSSNVNVAKVSSGLVKSTSSDIPCSSGVDSRKMANLSLNASVIREEDLDGGRFVSVEKWDFVKLTQWLENVGMLSSQIKNAQKTVLNGKVGSFFQ